VSSNSCGGRQDRRVWERAGPEAGFAGEGGNQIMTKMGRLFVRPIAFVSVLCAVCVGCAHQGGPSEAAKAYLQTHPNVSEQKQLGIKTGHVMEGMCPDEAIAAAGIPYFFEAQLDPKWPAHTDPQFVIEKQCSAPDKSKFTLYFENETQFGKKAKFKVIFENGQAKEISSL
jgi:hypothetical protein